MEVKGGRVELRNGRWLQNGHEMDRAPRAQALGFGKLLREAMLGRGMKAPGCGAASAFPDLDFDEGPTGSDVDGLVIGSALAYRSDEARDLADQIERDRQ
jgi:hypothetical protein